MRSGLCWLMISKNAVLGPGTVAVDSPRVHPFFKLVPTFDPFPGEASRRSITPEGRVVVFGYLLGLGHQRSGVLCRFYAKGSASSCSSFSGGSSLSFSTRGRGSCAPNGFARTTVGPLTLPCFFRHLYCCSSL